MNGMPTTKGFKSQLETCKNSKKNWNEVLKSFYRYTYIIERGQKFVN